MQAAINAAYSYLPADLPNPPVYAKVNPADAPILTLSLTSNTLPLSKVEDLADTVLAQKISQLSGGVGVDRRRTEADGEIVVMTPTKRETGSRNGYIVRMLGNWADADGRGEYYDSSTGFELPDGAVLSPDAAWASFEAVKAAEKDGKELPMCPEFVIELRSEPDRLAPAQEKMRLWMSYGAELAWLVDPQRKVVEVYRAGQERPDVLEGVTSVSGDGSVSGFVLELGKVWG